MLLAYASGAALPAGAGVCRGIADGWLRRQTSGAPARPTGPSGIDEQARGRGDLLITSPGGRQASTIAAVGKALQVIDTHDSLQEQRKKGGQVSGPALQSRRTATNQSCINLQRRGNVARLALLGRPDPPELGLR
jgi:hypothetical protein